MATRRKPPRPDVHAPAMDQYKHIAPWMLITQLYWMSYKLLERRFYELGVSDSQGRVLGLLYYAESPLKPSLVATLLFQETQSITGILQRLEARGWVQRQPDPDDRRAVGLQLTPSGREVAAKVVEVSEELYRDLFQSAMSAAERRQLEAALKKVRRSAFKLPETDFKLRRAQRHALWSD
ncbi:MAG: MarR family transcriptional regulator [Dehalococcoidia bacterium]